MTLILSVEKDLLTSNVIEWLIYYNIKFSRLNNENIINAEIEISNSNIRLAITKDKTINLKDYKSYWYRRGNFNLENTLLRGNTNTIWQINQHKTINCDDVKAYIHTYLSTHINAVNSYQDNSINKLTELTLAREIGITIPYTLITTCKKSALIFINEHENIITKTLTNSLNLEIDNVSFYWHTLLLTKKDIEYYPESFSPIKLQTCIDKAFELRVFYLNGKFYASAIFSQNDEQTKIDFRNYNESNPNRVIPYTLPKGEQIKFKSLMQNLNLKSGSLDIIVSAKGEYVFLEVNPIGQFTQVSYPCNYHLEREMALCLAN